MAFDNIKKAILDEAQKSAAEHRKAGQQKSEELAREWAQKTADKKQTFVEAAALKIDRKIRQTQFKIQTEIQSSILEKKQEIIDQVYESALEKLSKLSDTEYLKLMEKLINGLPDDPGIIFSAKEKKNLLKKALENSRKKHQLSAETIDSQGGFVYQSDKIEIKQSFEALINDAKEKTFLSVVNKVFN